MSRRFLCLSRWNRTAESPIRDWPISTRERVHARQYRLPGDSRRGGRDGRVHPRANGFPRENQGYVTQTRRRVRVCFLIFFFSVFLFPLHSSLPSSLDVLRSPIECPMDLPPPLFPLSSSNRDSRWPRYIVERHVRVANFFFKVLRATSRAAPQRIVSIGVCFFLLFLTKTRETINDARVKDGERRLRTPGAYATFLHFASWLGSPFVMRTRLFLRAIAK